MKQEYNKNPIYRVLYLFIGFYRFVGTANADIIDVNARMKLAKSSIQEQEVKLKLRIVKEYNKIKEIVILNVE
ncbi:hypothetical protein EPG14_09175 [Campylobacter coli]|nr:hypothetical protein [Campylobacter coli]